MIIFDHLVRKVETRQKKLDYLKDNHICNFKLDCYQIRSLNIGVFLLSF